MFTIYAYNTSVFSISQKFIVSNQNRYLFHPAGHVPHTEVFSAIMDDIHLDNLALIYIDSKTSELDTNLLYFAGTRFFVAKYMQRNCESNYQI